MHALYALLYDDETQQGTELLIPRRNKRMKLYGILNL